MFEFELPDVGEGVTEGEIVAWHVEPGDRVAEDEVLGDVETDKAVVELPSPVAGTVETLHADPGDVVAVGSAVVSIDTGDEDTDETAAAGDRRDGAEDDHADHIGDEDADGTTAARDQSDGAGDDHADHIGDEETDETTAAGDRRGDTAGDRVFAPPHVRRLARELDVDITAVDGSGPGGRVTEGDVRAVTDRDGATGRGGEATPGRSDAVAPDDTAGSPTPARQNGAGTATPGQVDRDRTLAVPATRGLARELGVDLDRVPTEKRRDGEAFVEPEDVHAHADGSGATAPTESAETTAGPDAVEPSHSPADAAATRATGETTATGRPVTREPYSGVRQTVGEQMAESRSTVPHATHYDTAVVPALAETRETLRERASEEEPKVTYLPFVLQAVVAALADYPALNAELDEDSAEIVYKEYYDIGVAVATDAGLLVPVVESVDEKGVLELAADVEDLAARARSRDLAPEELRGGTFTVTNVGAIGGEYATPIVNHPETAILGLGAVEPRPVVEDGEVVARETLPLSVSVDHRVVDGAVAARFCNTVVEYLEQPALLLA